MALPEAENSHFRASVSEGPQGSDPRNGTPPGWAGRRGPPELLVGQARPLTPSPGPHASVHLEPIHLLSQNHGSVHCDFKT